MKVDGSLRSLLQGVSQQPPRDRLPGQGTAQINMNSDPVSGLGRRAPTDLVGELRHGVGAQYFNFETKAGGKFILSVDHTWDGQKMTLVDHNADSLPITIAPDAEAYLATPGKLVIGVVDNLIVVANTTVIPSMLSDTKEFANAGDTGHQSAIIQILGGQYGREYRVSVNGVVRAFYKPPDGSEPAMVDFVRTNLIASRLFTAMTTTINESDADGAGSEIEGTGWFTANGYSVTRFDDTILVRRTAVGGNPIDITGSDDSGNINMKVMVDQVPDTEDLPRVAPHGYVTRIAQATDPDEDMYLEFIVEDESVDVGDGFGRRGYWRETVAPGVEYRIDAATMPHILEYIPDTDSFEFRRGRWEDRKAGTDISNPLPSFIDNPIQDVSTFQGRLVFLAGSYVCMSRTNREENFWMSSAAQLLDSDPIDISSTTLQASIMEAVVPHNRDLVVSSRSGQFIVPGRTAVTPANAVLQLTTAFEVELSAHPIPAGRNVFFATNYGRYTGIREFFTEGATDINDTRPVTQHVNKYIVGRAAQLSASSSHDILLVRTDSSDTDLYVYQYIWEDQQKIQAAWHTWRMPYTVKHVFFDEELVYFIMGNDTITFLDRMSLDVFDVDEIGYPVILDNRFDVFDCGQVFELPYDWLGDNPLVVVQGEGCPNPGLEAQIQSMEYSPVTESILVYLRNDMQGGHVIVGNTYLSLYKPTLPFPKDENGVVIGTAKLRVKDFLVSLSQTGHIIGQAYSRYDTDEPVEFQARIVGAVNNLVGHQSLSDELFQLPFRRQTSEGEIELRTERHLPMTILDIEWTGQYTKKGRRLNV